MNADELSSKGTYVKAVPTEESASRIAEVCRMINVPNRVPKEDLHTTILYSRAPVDAEGRFDDLRSVSARGVGFDIFEDGPNRCLVVKLESNGLSSMHSELRKLGGTHDYPSYNPHVTLSYDYGNNEPPNDDLLQYFRHIDFNKIVVEPLDLDWTA